MGVPALFRWLSKKYPKIISRVEEDDPQRVPAGPDEPDVVIPVDISSPNPNGEEFDNLYLDMNGIVHPCTHPEGKPAPETEEDMMLEIFAYTERVVSMVRPRKLLFMAIDGVAPRAKMNQQRSRRFRAAQEAEEAKREKEESMRLMAQLGHPVSDETRNKKAWDSNAITPGTPFMDLLAASLRYWVVQKMNTDSAWASIEVIISDASVPGEGEHKIMDFIRRQRVNVGHDPNTRHVIYGLDADLIMLALATHEPHFKVLREDVFFQPNGGSGCRKCGEQGHFAANCTNLAPKKPVIDLSKPLSETKPFIFLDVSVLREYLAIELALPNQPFAFDLERALDDWIFLIFFVGNDFLPHLPSLEIREGAVDTLLRIWKGELGRLGGYVTNHGRLELDRVQVILDGLAKEEAEIFRRRRESEERQENNAKRRKVDEYRRQNGGAMPPSVGSNLATVTLGETELVQVPVAAAPPRVGAAAAAGAAGLPSRPAFNTVSRADEAASDKLKAVQAFGSGGSNADIVKSRREARMANMSAAEMLRAQLAGSTTTTTDGGGDDGQGKGDDERQSTVADNEADNEPRAAAVGAGSVAEGKATVEKEVAEEEEGASAKVTSEEAAAETGGSPPHRGVKRKVDDDPDLESTTPLGSDGLPSAVVLADEEEEGAPVTELATDPVMDRPIEVSKARKVNPDGSVDVEDTVKLWEPGYKERYYRQKFGVELSDAAFRKKVTMHYIEGLCWVLHYYYQGTPSWQWYYPFHFAPFAADFEDVGQMDIQFTLGAPFKPFEQLMGVFPAASKVHIPSTFQPLMYEPESPIIDFYPPDFEIDMNGKKMQWQGVALLPFIDPVRLLEAMGPRYPALSEDDVKRNAPGRDVLFVADKHALYDAFCRLYSKKQKEGAKTPIDPALSKGISGYVDPDPNCVPGSTYYTPLPSTPLGDITDDHSLSVNYSFPPQNQPHRSVLLPGLVEARKILTQSDADRTRRGGNDSRGGRNGGGGRGGGMMGGPGSGGYHGSGRGGAQNGGGGRGGGFGSPWSTGSATSSHAGSPYPDSPRGYGSSAYGANGGGGPGGGYVASPTPAGYARGAYSNGSGGGGGGYAPPPPTTYGIPPAPTLPVYGRGPPPPSGSYGGYGGGGGPAQQYGGYGSSYPGASAPPPPLPPPGGGQYGGYGGYGGPPPPTRGAYGNGGRGAPRGGARY